VPTIRIKSLKFDSPAFRKLENITIQLQERITVIAGHNGIGKSTILGLISNGSGLSDASSVSYLNRTYQANLNEIVHLDFEKEYEVYKDSQEQLPSPQIEYEIDGQSLTKRCAITGRTDSRRVRVVPRNHPHQEFSSVSGIQIGKDAKVPLPTIYLGMTRMLPVGESNPEWITSAVDKSIHEADATFIKNFVAKVIKTDAEEGSPQLTAITTQSIKGTGKTSKHPQYTYNPRCVSLGQDSLSAIATALASFKKLEREWSDYPGGLLVIDEIDAGFHPRAQQKLVEAIANAARKLRIQVIATTHSVAMIEAVHPSSNPVGAGGKHVDGVLYLTDTYHPRVADEFSLADVKRDMSLIPPAAVPKPKLSTKSSIWKTQRPTFL
jgi:predicted ATPase